MCGIVGYVGPRDAAPILMKDYTGSNTAATTRRASPSRAAASCASTRAKARSASSRADYPRSCAAARRHRTHALGDARRAERPQRASAQRRSRIGTRSCTTASSRTQRSCGHASKLRASRFRSQTDSEVLAHLIAAMSGDARLEDRVRAALRLRHRHVRPRGPRCRAARSRIVVARNGSPVILGIGDREMFVASDAAALVRHTQQHRASRRRRARDVRADGYETSTLAGGATQKTPLTIDWAIESLDKGDHAHFMRKEIAEQPDAIRRTLSGRLEARFQTTHLGGLETAARELLEVRRVKILGCGSALHRGLHGRAADRAARARYRRTPSPHPSSATAIPSSSPTRCTSRSASRARPSTRSRPCKKSSARAAACSASSTSSAARSRANAAAASICTRGRRSPSSRPRRSPARPWPSRCSRSTSAGCATCRRRAARGCSPRSNALPEQVAADPRGEEQIAAVAACNRREPRRLLRRPRGGSCRRAGGRAEAQRSAATYTPKPIRRRS